jgi:hypothetical protein
MQVEQVSQSNKTPSQIKLLAVLLAVNALASFVIGVNFVMQNPESSPLWFFGGAAMIVGVLLGISAYGVVNLEKWGYMLSLICLALLFFAGMLGDAILGSAISALAMYYLLKKDTRRLFLAR